MARIEPKSACLWHAFHALKDSPDSDVVKKAKLKVLTHNIANCLGLVKREEKLDNYEADHMTFPSYLGFLRSEIFCNVRDTNQHTSSSSLEKVDEVCWFLCCKNYMTRAPVVLEQSNLYILWKITNTVAELDSDDMAVVPVVVDSAEIRLLAKEFCKIVGTTFDAEEFGNIIKEVPRFTYEHILNYFETHLCQGEGHTLDTPTTTTALKELQDSVIYEVIKKGMLIKKGNNLVTGFKERWFVLSPTSLKYFSSSDEKDLKGEVSITPLCRVEANADTPTRLPQSSSRYPYKFKISTPGRTYEICAPDVKTRGEWQTAIRTAVEYCKKAKTPQEIARSDRRDARRRRREKDLEDEMRRKESIADMDRAREELEALRKAREEAEALAREEAERRKREEELVAQARRELEAERQERLRAEAEAKAERERLENEKKVAEEKHRLLEKAREEREEIEARLREVVSGREEDQRQLDELLSDRRKLEGLLEEEIRAKRDEEIVRNLQAKALQEEYDKRETLERLRADLEATLSTETQRRVGLEETRRQQEETLRLEQAKMELIELNKQQIEQQLKDAEIKLEEANKLKLEMQEKFSKKKPEILQRLAAHLPDNEKFEIVTHRGLGAFSEADFRKTSTTSPPTSPRLYDADRDSDSGVPSDSSDSPEAEKKHQNEDVFSGHNELNDDTESVATNVAAMKMDGQEVDGTSLVEDTLQQRSPTDDDHIAVDNVASSTT